MFVLCTLPFFYELAVSCFFLHVVCVFCMFCVWFLYCCLCGFKYMFYELAVGVFLRLLCVGCVRVWLCIISEYAQYLFMNLLCMFSIFVVNNLCVFCVWFVCVCVFFYVLPTPCCELALCVFCIRGVCFCVFCVRFAYHTCYFFIAFLMNLLCVFSASVLCVLCMVCVSFPCVFHCLFSESVACELCVCVFCVWFACRFSVFSIPFL